jgi:hypothetical protein
MYDSLIWWLTIITPGVLLITCLIWRMESGGLSNSHPLCQVTRKIMCGNEVKMTVNTTALYFDKRT